MQSPSSSSSSAAAAAAAAARSQTSAYGQGPLPAQDYSATAAMHHNSVFEHPHHPLAYAGLHHGTYPPLHPQLSHHHPHHPHHQTPHAHHYLPAGNHQGTHPIKRDHQLEAPSSDEEHLSDVKPSGLSAASEAASALRAGRGSGIKPPGGGNNGGGDASLSGGKKTKGRVKIKMEFIDNKLRRYTTFSKRKTGIMKKAYELSTLTGTQVMLLVASETGHVYTFATRKLQPMITSDAGKALIQTCLNSPDPLGGGPLSGGDQRMSATGYEETELTYNVAADEESQKVRQMMYNSSHYSPSSSHSSQGHNLFSPLSPNSSSNNNNNGSSMYPAPSPSPSSHPGYPGGSSMSISPGLSHSPNHHSPPFGGHPR